MMAPAEAAIAPAGAPAAAPGEIPAPRGVRLGFLLRGLAALICGQGIRTLGHLVLVPVYLRHWTATAYGEWLALASLTASLSAFDLGVSTASANRLTQEHARGDGEAYARTQASALAFYTAVALGGAALLAVAVWALPIAGWLGLRAIAPADAAWVAWLLGAQILLALPVGLLAAVYRTTGRLAWTEWLGNARALGVLALVPLVLALGGGMPALAALQLLPLAGVGAFVLWDLAWRWPALVPRPTRARAAALRELLGPSLLFAVMVLANALAMQGAVLLVMRRLGGAAVAVFVTSRTLTGLIRQAVLTLNNAIWPQLTAMEALCDYRRLRVLHQLLALGAGALAVAFAATLWQVGDEVIAFWSAGALVADTGLLRLLLVHVVLQASWVASSLLPVALNRPRTVAAASATANVIGLAVAAVLMGRLGTWAVPVGLIAGEAVACSVLVPRAACRLVQADYGAFARRQWVGLAAAATVALPASWLAAQAVAGPALLRWPAVGVAGLLGSALGAWALGLDGEARGALARRARAALSRPGARAEVPVA